MHNHHGKARPITLGTFEEWCGGMSDLSDSARRRRLGPIVHDSRKVRRGDVFLALKTGRNDGHDYIEAAFRAGALAAIAAKGAGFTVSPKYESRVIRVKDPLAAVQRAGRRYRRELGILIVGVTGSSGKTTTRSFISAVLAGGFPVGETFTNWNNHIGVPLSLLRFTGEEWLGVIEMGANHPGEIGALSRIAEPDIGVITNIGYAHVGLFGSLSRTTEAKFEITEGLNRDKGFLLLNGDDLRLVREARRRRVNAFFFGYSPRCHIRPEGVAVDRDRGISFSVDGCRFTMRTPGRHFIYSALPAIFLGRRCGIPDGMIAEALRSVKPVSMRGTIEPRNGIDFIVDCYNANPSSMRSALEFLGDVAGEKRRVAVVGDMLELGPFSKRLHRDLGSRIVRSGVNRLVAVGAYAEQVLEGAREAGMRSSAMRGSESAESALPLVRAAVQPGDTVLLKGSRGVHLETIFDDFAEPDGR